MGGSGSKSKGFWPFSGSGSVDDPTKDGNEQSMAKVRSFPSVTPFVLTRKRRGHRHILAAIIYTTFVLSCLLTILR